MKLGHLFLTGFFLSLYIFGDPVESYAGRNLRGMSPREWEPLGQMRGDIFEKTSTFRITRTQQERRPRDARAIGPQDMGLPGGARPELINVLRRDRRKGYGGGWLWVGVGEVADQSEGWTPLMPDGTDTTNIYREEFMSTTEWWEQKLRGQGQRGGWFRARFGSTSGGGARAGGGSSSTQTTPQFQQPSTGTQGSSSGGIMGGGGF